MKKIFSIFFINILILLSVYIHGDENDFNSITKQIKESIEVSFKDKGVQSLSIVKLENFSGLNDLAVLRLYQTIARALESSDKIKFKDLFVGMNNKKAEFKSVRDIDLLMFLKITRERGRLGIGITIFSTKINSLVYLKYFSIPLKEQEISLLEFNAYNLSGGKYIPLLEKDFFYKKIYDVESYSEENGQIKVALLLENKIDLFILQGRVLKRESTISYNDFSIDSGVKEKEGRINYFKSNGKSYIAIAFNDSKESQLFVLSDGKWSFFKKIDYLPHGLISVGNKKLILGYKYFLGRDYFSKEIILGDSETFNILYKKSIRDFYDINLFYKGDDYNIYIIALDNKIESYTNNFNKETELNNLVGGQLTTSEDKVFYTSIQLNGDKVFLYDYKKNQSSELFSTKQSIVKLKRGDFMGIKGLWIITKDSENKKKLMFYGKKS